ncbi:MAG: cytochrome c oxidase subunit 3 [Chthoniobacterales bacterium]
MSKTASENPLTSSSVDFSKRLEPPGGILVWLIVILELITFAAGIGVYLAQQRAHPEEFVAGAATLNQPLAFANTMLLLTGGWCMAVAIASLHEGREKLGRLWIQGAIFTGVAFMILKLVEWSEKIRHGASFGEDHFYTAYFALTGFHFLHVFVAVLILAYLCYALKRGRYSATNYFDIESGGIFWHMCDLIWLLLYPAIYLLS